MISLKTKEEIGVLKEGGGRLAKVMKGLEKKLKSGISSLELDRLCESLIFYYGGRPSFKNYAPDKKLPVFPFSLCVSINETIVHGLPNKDIVLKKGDVVSLDVGMIYKGLYTDMAKTYIIGNVSKPTVNLIKAVNKSLNLAIKIAKPGKTLGDIGFVIQRHISRQGFNIIYNLTGHGVGFAVHEDPFIFNFGTPGKGEELKEGMVLAIEPMASLGSSDIIQNKDGSFKTADDSISAHFEHTIAIVKGGNIVLTKE